MEINLKICRQYLPYWISANDFSSSTPLSSKSANRRPGFGDYVDRGRLGKLPIRCHKCHVTRPFFYCNRNIFQPVRPVSP